MSAQAQTLGLDRLHGRLNWLNGAVLGILFAALILMVMHFFVSRSAAPKAVTPRPSGSRGSVHRVAAKEVMPVTPAPTLPAVSSGSVETQRVEVKQSAPAPVTPMVKPNPVIIPPATSKPVPSRAGAEDALKSSQPVDSVGLGAASPVANSKASFHDGHCHAPGWYVQLGALRGEAFVRALVARGRSVGVDFCTTTVDAKGLTLVMVGPYPDAHVALKSRQRMQHILGIKGFLRKYAGRD